MGSGGFTVRWEGIHFLASMCACRMVMGGVVAVRKLGIGRMLPISEPKSICGQERGICMN